MPASSWLPEAAVVAEEEVAVALEAVEAFPPMPI